MLWTSQVLLPVYCLGTQDKTLTNTLQKWEVGVWWNDSVKKDAKKDDMLLFLQDIKKMEKKLMLPLHRALARYFCWVLPPGTSSGYFRRLLLLFVLTMLTSQLVAGEHGHGVFGGHESEVIWTFYMKYFNSCWMKRLSLFGGSYRLRSSKFIL